MSDADGVAYLGEGLEGFFQLPAGDPRSIRRLGGNVKRPDLHAADALVEQTLRQAVGVEPECEQVLVGALRHIAGPQRPILRALEECVAFGGAHVAVAGARIVDRHALMRAAAEQTPDRLAERLSINVPQRDVDRGVAANFGARITRPDIDAAEAAVVQLDIARILADQVGRDVVMQVCGDRPGRPEGLARSNDAGIGMHA